MNLKNCEKFHSKSKTLKKGIGLKNEVVAMESTTALCIVRQAKQNNHKA